MATFNAIYDILERLGGAQPGFRADFIHHFTSEKHPATEWRFGGHFGFGGKFWRNAGQFYVTMYREDETPERRECLAEINAELAKIPYIEP